MDRLSEIRARCEAATPGPWKIGKESPSGAQNVGTLDGILTAQTTSESNAAFIAASRTLVPQLCDALEAAQKEIERLNKSTATLGNMINQYADQARNAIDQQEHDRAFYEKSVSEYNARLEKAEAEIKSIHESLNFADKSRSKCANYVELAVSNGLALGRIAVAIQHDYDAEPPKGE